MGRCVRHFIAAGWLAVGVSGCQTPSREEVQTSAPSARFLGTETVKTFESQIFLECIDPESTEMKERKLTRNGMERADYYNDRANKDRPISVGIPDLHTVSWAAGERDPYFTLQLRERTRVLRAKSYELTTTLVDDNKQFVRKSLDRVNYPRFYDWAWNPDRLVTPSRRIEFVLPDLLDASGICIRGEGLMDMNGTIRFDLRPYLSHGAARPDGLLFSFNCPSAGSFCNVRVTREVFASYLDATP
jgi:hypothetical protein